MSRRLLPVWFALAFAGGAVNASALSACQRFVSHITGCLTRFAMDYTSLRLVFDYGAVVCAFVLGAMSSVWFLDGRRRRGLAPYIAAPLGLVAVTLVLATVGGLMGYFGRFGTTVETNADFVLLGLLAFAMGLQNASVGTITGMMVRTTHMTGPLTDFSVALGSYARIPEVRAPARRDLTLRGVKMLGFLAGAFVAAVLARRVEYSAFLLPAGIIAVCSYLLSTAVATAEKEAHPEHSSAPLPAKQDVPHPSSVSLAPNAVHANHSESAPSSVPSLAGS